MLRRIAGFLAGLVAGYAGSIAVYAAYTTLTEYNDREGAAAMGVAFFIAPAVALICGIVGAVWAARRRA